MEVVGYAEIKKDATTGTSAIPMDNFLGKVCRVFEFTPEGDVLIIDDKATGIATFDACDIHRKFECKVVGDVITPPNMNMIEQTVYVAKVLSRKGGYNTLLKNMVIQASLMKGKFNDNFLFQVQEQEYNMKKKRYEKIKNIRERIAKGEATTFAERNIVNIEDKKKRDKDRKAEALDKKLKSGKVVKHQVNMSFTI